VTKLSKNLPPLPEVLDSGEVDRARRAPATRARTMERTSSRNNIQSSTSNRPQQQTLREVLSRFKRSINDDDVGNHLVVETSADLERGQFEIYFKKKLYKPKILDRTTIENNDCFRVSIFMLNKESLEASGSVTGGALNLFVGTVKGNIKGAGERVVNGGTSSDGGDGKDGTPSKPLTFISFVEGIPWKAANEKCPSGRSGGSTDTGSSTGSTGQKSTA